MRTEASVGPRRPHVASLVLLAIVGFSVPVLADAPAGQYAAFDQSDATIFDQQTRLRWRRNVPTTATSFSLALSACRNAGTGLRLPTLKELLTLVDEEPAAVYTSTGSIEPEMIDQQAFGGYQQIQYSPVDRPYWTASEFSTDEAWQLDFKDGRPRPVRKDTPGYVRCVVFQP
jgi:hypothetical protein